MEVKTTDFCSEHGTKHECAKHAFLLSVPLVFCPKLFQKGLTLPWWLTTNDNLLEICFSYAHKPI